MTKTIFKVGEANIDMPVRQGDIIEFQGKGFRCQITNESKETKLLAEILAKNKISLIPLDKKSRMDIFFENIERETREFEEKYEKVCLNE